VSTRSSHTPARFTVDLPAGGKLQLHSVDEVELWEQSAARYVKDYALRQQNDLLSLGAILSQVLAQFRAQQRMNGMTIERDGNGSPTGRYLQKEPSIQEMSAAQSTITKAQEEIREIEKSLGIDKKTREAGGQHTVANYVMTVKEAAREYGIHLSRRLLAYEKFTMELRWKLRVLRQADAEDRNYHNLTDATLISWAEDELARLEEVDKKYAREKGRIFVGRLR
jgi:hypothetical protein